MTITNALDVSRTTGGLETIEYFKYNEKFYAPLNPTDLVESFRDVVNFIATDIASPIEAGTDLVITDVIGEGFLFDVSQVIEGATAIQTGDVYRWTITDSSSKAFGTMIAYDADTHTITWTIPASQLCLFDPPTWENGENPYSVDVAIAKLNQVTFKVTAIGQPLLNDIDNYNGEPYYTNSEARSKYVNYHGDHISEELNNNGWVTYEFTNPTGDFRVKKFVDNGELVMSLYDWSLTHDDFDMLRSLITFNLYASDIDGLQRDTEPVAHGILNADGMITFSEKVESGWYLLRESIMDSRVADIFEAHDDWCFYFYANQEYVVGHSTAFNYDSLYTIINGYNYPGYRNLGYQGLNNNGDLFYIGIENADGDSYASFCANAGSRNFAGDATDCEGYMVPKSFSSLERTGVGDKPYEYFISALNYINDNHGDLSANRAITQTVIWALLGAIDTCSGVWATIADRTDGTGLTSPEKEAVEAALAAAEAGYVGSASIVDLVYLTCPEHSEPGQFEFCQPQLVPVFDGEVSFINKLRTVSSYSIEYYYDNVIDNSKTETGTATVGTVISAYTDNEITGYEFSTADNFPLIIRANADDNVIKVYYVKDETQTRNVVYTVKYIVDGTEMTDDTYTVAVPVWILAPADVSVSVADIDILTYVGYRLSDDYVQPETAVHGEVIIVPYVKDETQTRNVVYTVKYTLDGVEVTADTYTVTKKVWILAPADVSVSVDAISAENGRYTGYKLVVNPFVTPKTAQDGAIITVPYTKDVDELLMTGINWNNGNGNGNGGGINQFSVNGITLKNNKNYLTPANFDATVTKAPAKNAETAIYTVDERAVQNPSGAYEKVYYIRVALFDSVTSVWKIYAGTVSVDNPGGNNSNQQVVLTRIP